MPGIRMICRATGVTLALVGAGGLALSQADPAMQRPLRDPWVPPQVAASAASSASASAAHRTALSAQVERQLRERFDAADTGKTGRLTREQARAAGLGYIDKSFEQIDTARQGSVGFEDVKRFLRGRGAAI
jgi:hypothetical protein